MRVRVLLVIALVSIGATACAGPNPPALDFPRAGVSVPWQTWKAHGHSFARTVNGRIHDQFNLDGGDGYPQFLVGWRDGDAIQSLLVVPDHASVTAGRSAVVERVTDPGGHHVVLATSTRVNRPYAPLTVTWPGGRIRFLLAPSAL